MASLATDTVVYIGSAAAGLVVGVITALLAWTIVRSGEPVREIIRNARTWVTFAILGVGWVGTGIFGLLSGDALV